MAIPSTTERVPSHTAEEVNRRILDDMDRRVRLLETRPADITHRLHELDEEWDIERAIEANASSLAFLGIVLGYFAHPYWLALPALVTLFLFQHAIQGWCPPVPILRRLGFRTANEIERERHALKAVRGDYMSLSSNSLDKASAALRAVDAR